MKTEVKPFDIVDVWWIKDQNRVAVVGAVDKYTFNCMCVTTGETKKLRYDKILEVRDLKLKNVLKI
jgi:hypothetical protein